MRDVEAGTTTGARRPSAAGQSAPPLRRRGAAARGSGGPDSSGTLPAVVGVTPPAAPAGGHVLVDGENIDWALGSVLGHKPTSDERPRWDRVLEFARKWSKEDMKGLFFLNVTGGEIPLGFAQALQTLGFQPICLTGEGLDRDVKVVDVAILRTLDALAERDSPVVVLSHDGDFAAKLSELAVPSRKLGVLGFPEAMAAALRDLRTCGVDILDLETDADAFQEHVHLKRLRPIPLDRYDPAEFL